jgi:mannose-6-phosphate isomerase-like protein (cupin superfamily)
VDKVNILEALGAIDEHWSQKIIGEANGQLFKLAKGSGPTNWHKHDDQDELFIVYRGRLTIELRDRAIDLAKDEMFIVPRGVEHRPVAHGEVHLLVVGSTVTSTKEGGKPN